MHTHTNKNRHVFCFKKNCWSTSKLVNRVMFSNSDRKSLALHFLEGKYVAFFSFQCNNINSHTTNMLQCFKRQPQQYKCNSQRAERSNRMAHNKHGKVNKKKTCICGQYGANIWLQYLLDKHEINISCCPLALALFDSVWLGVALCLQFNFGFALL